MATFQSKENKIYMHHIREAMLCCKGLRYFAKLHGFNYSDFVKNGISISKVKDMDDVMVQKVIKLALKK